MGRNSDYGSGMYQQLMDIMGRLETVERDSKEKINTLNDRINTFEKENAVLKEENYLLKEDNARLKSIINRLQKLKYFGFGFYKDSKAKEWKRRPHQESVRKFKGKLKELTCRKTLGTVTDKIAKINQVTRGWINYYALGSMKTVMTEMDAHLRTRLRIIIWK